MTLSEKLAGLKKSLPYKGRGGRYGASKLTGCCPRCGSYTNYGYHLGRFKSCTRCGYDRFFDRLFDAARYAVKKGGSGGFSEATLKLVLGYYARVYGNHASS